MRRGWLDFGMACLPLIERELRVALRKQRPARSRLRVAGLAVAGSVFFLLFGILTGERNMGRGLEQMLCMAGLYFVVLVPMLTAGALAEERRNQTLGLLFLSGLGAGEVFASKLLSSALIAFTNLLAIFPMLALPFLIGGVSYDLFIATVCMLPVLMLFALAMSMLASAMTREEGSAVILAFVLGTLFCALTPATYFARIQFSPGVKPSLWWLRMSPAYGPRLVWSGFHSGFRATERAEFWQNLIVTLGWSALALGVAALALNRFWRDQEAEVAPTGLRERWRKIMHGGREYRRRLAGAWLEANPFIWMAGRDRQPVTLGWLVIGGIMLVWLLCFAAWPAHWLGAPNFFITATLLNSVLAWLTRYTAARELGLARRDGVYELLLTTSLNPTAIVWGTLNAIRLNFRSLANFVLLLNVLLMLGGLAARRWNAGALIEYFLIWFFLLAWSWSLGRRMTRLLPVMWTSLNCGRPAYAVWRTAGFNSWSWIWILFNARNMGRGFQRFPAGTIEEVVIVSFVTLIFLIIWFARRHTWEDSQVQEPKWYPEAKMWLHPNGEPRLIREFREIVREPLPDPNDPRFKKWNVAERFPWGWRFVQQQLHERLARK